jgi:selenophosphate synthetase-related protein
MKIVSFLFLPPLLFSCSKTIISNGVKVSGIIKEKNIELPIINNIITDSKLNIPHEEKTEAVFDFYDLNHPYY